jgi:hypothetical protein
LLRGGWMRLLVASLRRGSEGNVVKRNPVRIPCLEPDATVGFNMEFTRNISCASNNDLHQMFRSDPLWKHE